jgi:hypothetical protein
MGDDSKVQSRHRRRTPPHKKHEAYPGMRNPANASIENRSIKPMKVETKPLIIDLSKTRSSVVS